MSTIIGNPTGVDEAPVPTKRGAPSLPPLGDPIVLACPPANVEEEAFSAGSIRDPPHDAGPRSKWRRWWGLVMREENPRSSTPLALGFAAWAVDPATATEELGDALEALALMHTRGEPEWACRGYALRIAVVIIWHGALYRIQALLRGEKAGSRG